jgi:hypothetical protein
MSVVLYTEEGLNELSLSKLTDIYNSLTGRDVAKLKCSKGEAVSKVLRAQLAKQEDSDPLVEEMLEGSEGTAVDTDVAAFQEFGDAVEYASEPVAAVTAVEVVEPTEAPVADISPITGRPKKHRGVVLNRQASVPARIIAALRELSVEADSFFGIAAIAARAETKPNTTANYLSNFVAGRMSLPEGITLQSRRGAGRFVEWRVAVAEEGTMVVQPGTLGTAA